MPDIYIERHGDRWSVKDAPDATPFFESYTLQEAEAEARRRAEGGRIHVHGTEEGETAVGQGVDPARAPEPRDLQEQDTAARRTELAREAQAGL